MRATYIFTIILLSWVYLVRGDNFAHTDAANITISSPASAQAAHNIDCNNTEDDCVDGAVSKSQVIDEFITNDFCSLKYIYPADIPYTITASGNYLVTGNLDMQSTGTVITIDADCVTLDLCEFVVSGSSSLGTVGVVVSSAHQNVTVQKGQLTDLYQGIIIEDDTDTIIIQDITCKDITFRAIDFIGLSSAYIVRSAVRRCTIQGCANVTSSDDHTVVRFAYCRDLTVSNCICYQNGSAQLTGDFTVIDFVLSEGIVAHDMQIYLNNSGSSGTSSMVAVRGSDYLNVSEGGCFEHWYISDNEHAGFGDFFLWHCSFAENHFFNDVVIRDNRATVGPTIYGFHAIDSASLQIQYAQCNWQQGGYSNNAGFFLSGSNMLVQQSKAEFNDGNGGELSGLTQSVLHDIIFDQNGLYGITVSDASTELLIKKTFAIDSGSHGFYIQSSVGSDLEIKECQSYRNTGNGFQFDTTVSGLVFVKNVACNNAINYNGNLPTDMVITSPENARGWDNIDCDDTSGDAGISKLCFIEDLIPILVGNPVTIAQADMPYTITASGSYRVVEDLTTTSTCITINADDVLLDICGFELSGATYRAIEVVSSHQNIIIKNGVLRNLGSGIHVQNDCSLVHIEDMLFESIVQNAIHFAGSSGNEIKNSRVLRSIMRDCDGFGSLILACIYAQYVINLEIDTMTVTECGATSNYAIGLYGTNLRSCVLKNVEVSNNTVASGGAYTVAFIQDSVGCIVESCRVSNNASGQCLGVVFYDTECCRVSNLNVINNQSIGNTYGIFVNAVTAPRGHIFENIIVSHNTASDDSIGILINGAILKIEDVLVRNCVIEENTVTSGFYHGIQMQDVSIATILDTVIKDNTGTDTCVGFILTGTCEYINFVNCSAIGHSTPTSSYGFQNLAGFTDGLFLNCFASANSIGFDFGATTNVSVVKAAAGQNTTNYAGTFPTGPGAGNKAPVTAIASVSGWDNIDKS